jgi:hypothetical protein
MLLKGRILFKKNSVVLSKANAIYRIMNATGVPGKNVVV